MPDIMINSPDGKLEARYAPSKNSDAPIALFLHPNPLHGGTMNNKVVYNLFHTFYNKGFTCLRFNFRGVGRSTGKFDKGEGELHDAATALDWLQRNNERGKQCWIVGFSFGAWIGLQLLMRRPEVFRFVVVAPPSNKYDFNFLSPCPTSGLLIQGTKDSIVPIDAQESLRNHTGLQPHVTLDYKIIEGADHFMTNYMNELQSIVKEYIDEHIILTDRSLRHPDNINTMDNTIDFLTDDDDISYTNDDDDDDDLDDEHHH